VTGLLLKVEPVLSWVGAPLLDQIKTLRLSFKLFILCCSQLLKPWRVKEILKQTSHMSLGALPLVILSTAFAGIVMTNEIAWHMDLALHTLTMIPGFTTQFILREIGVAIPAMLIISKVGAGMAAELGGMKITDQLDALKVLKIDLVEYLIFPRWIGCILTLICLTWIALGVTLGCAIFIAVFRYGFNPLEYIQTMRQFVGMEDLICAFVKALVFGVQIPIICCAYGLRCRMGAQGVGFATTQAVVTCTMILIVWDFLITWVFTQWI